MALKFKHLFALQFCQQITGVKKPPLTELYSNYIYTASRTRLGQTPLADTATTNCQLGTDLGDQLFPNG